MVATTEQLIQTASLFLALALLIQQFVGATLHFTERAHVLLVKLSQVALVLIEQVGQGFERSIERVLTLLHGLLLGLLEVMDRLLEHPIGKVLEYPSHVVEGLFVFETNARQLTGSGR